jgi:hypothetical protein
MRATSGEGILSGERVERRLAAILAADVRGSAFNAKLSKACGFVDGKMVVFGPSRFIRPVRPMRRFQTFRPRPERGDSSLSGRVTARSAAVFQSVNQVRQLAEAKTTRLTS